MKCRHSESVFTDITFTMQWCSVCGSHRRISVGETTYMDCYMSNDSYGFPTATYGIPDGADIEIIRKQAERYFDNVIFVENTNGQSLQLCPKEWSQNADPNDDAEESNPLTKETNE